MIIKGCERLSEEDIKNLKWEKGKTIKNANEIIQCFFNLDFMIDLDIHSNDKTKIKYKNYFIDGKEIKGDTELANYFKTRKTPNEIIKEKMISFSIEKGYDNNLLFLGFYKDAYLFNVEYSAKKGSCIGSNMLFAFKNGIPTQLVGEECRKYYRLMSN